MDQSYKSKFFEGIVSLKFGVSFFTLGITEDDFKANVEHLVDGLLSVVP